LSYYTVENLLRSGEVVDVNFFHAKIDTALAPQKLGYIAKQQYIGIESNQGAGIPSHLHVEVSDRASPAWVCTNTARPGLSGNPDDNLAKDNLQAHYGDGYCKVGTSVQYNNQSPIYFGPGEVFAQSELLPYLSLSNPTPSFTDYDVYGIANQPLYGQLQMHRDNSKTFQGVGILIKGGADRQNPLDIPLLGRNGKWLARTWTGDVDFNNSSVAKVTIQGDFPITDMHTYTQPGDYQLMSFVAETTKNFKKGYPIIFSLLDSERSKIIDNDKTTEKQADSSMREVYSQSPGSSNLSPKDNTSPGYYLSSQRVRGQSGAYAQWKPGLVGDYRMYAFVPSGSSGKKIVYKVKEDGTDATLKAAYVVQENQGSYWAPLVWSELTDSDGNGVIDVADLVCQSRASSTEATVFNLQDKNGDGWGDGYVGLGLSKTATGTANSPTSNAHLTAQDWLAFDAIKFEVAENTNTDIAIGKTYQGGIVFYLDSTGKHGLIAAPTDQNNTGIQWYNGSYFTTGATGTAIGTGLANTNAIVTAQGEGSYAAKLSADLVIGAYSDWYLPSRDELNLMYHNIGQGAAAPLTNVGGFAGYYYWSSSERDGGYDAWFQFFGNGPQYGPSKSDPLYVRAVRDF
jgi:hypothetical protein